MMVRVLAWLMLAAWLLPALAGADQRPAKGTLLVATELVRGDFFEETIVLLLHYDETGAMGLVVNRPTEMGTEELLAGLDAVADYQGTIFWGGPVEVGSLRALLRTDTPPEGAQAIVDSVHQVPMDDWLKDAPQDPASLRFFIGYAGWGPGQLDHEMARGSWHVVPASDELVFTEDPHTLWQRLTPPREFRAAVYQDRCRYGRLFNPK
ncbi:MAG: hypothetical protein GTN98_15485 [Woeseiaceae bacterium]|nr:hypothetical protein [Woeseiaceae bacterium]